MSKNSFHICEICGSDQWKEIYNGPIRDGKFGSLTKPTVIGRCGGCGVARLAESNCKQEEFYIGKDYRKSLGQTPNSSDFFEKHDELQEERLKIVPPGSVRGKRVADIGCAAGSFLDHISGTARELVAVEPGSAYHDSLKERGFKTYSFAKEAQEIHLKKIDIATSFDVIEHTLKPRHFLAEIAALLAKNGLLIVSTPNRKDAMIEIGGETYQQFFYRTHHRWYFDLKSLITCAQLAGLEVVKTHCIQRYGLSNAINWIKYGRPCGTSKIQVIDSPIIDEVWKRQLEISGSGDRIYAVFKPLRA